MKLSYLKIQVRWLFRTGAGTEAVDAPLHEGYLGRQEPLLVGHHCLHGGLDDVTGVAEECGFRHLLALKNT